MTYTVILLVTRNANLTTEEFKYHYENTHIPLARSLLGGSWPKSFRRRYLARITRNGFGGPANPDRPVLTLRGDMLDDDYDCIATMDFDSEETFQDFYRKIYETNNAAILARDEEKFLEPGRTRAVVVGETWGSDEGGATTIDVGVSPKIGTPESATSGTS